MPFIRPQCVLSFTEGQEDNFTIYNITLLFVKKSVLFYQTKTKYNHAQKRDFFVSVYYSHVIHFTYISLEKMFSIDIQINPLFQREMKNIYQS